LGLPMIIWGGFFSGGKISGVSKRHYQPICSGQDKETAWAERSYIADLYNIERLIKQGGIKSVIQGYMFKALSSRYPVEWECIKKELAAGELTTPEEFARLKREQEESTAEEKAARAQQEAEAEARSQNLWFQMGGKP